MLINTTTWLLESDRCAYHPTRTAPARQFPLTRPSVIVDHYDVCHDIDMNRRAVMASGLDYHLALDGWHDGTHSQVRIYQYVPFNLRGAHAKGWNGASIGVATVNPGPLVRGEDGKLRTTYGREWPEDEAVEATMPGTRWTWWARWTDEEIEVRGQLYGLLARAIPSIEAIRGHSAVTPGKVDPGPAARLDMVREIASDIAGRKLGE